MAEQAGLDLVEIAPNADPPVCKILDLGKLKYQNQKKAAEARKKQKTVEVKEIKMRPNIDTHDYQVKMKAMNRFFEEGDKVKVTLRFRGREMAHQELGLKLLRQVKEDTLEIAKVEAEPKLEGRQMMMVLAPRLGPHCSSALNCRVLPPGIREGYREGARRLRHEFARCAPSGSRPVDRPAAFRARTEIFRRTAGRAPARVRGAFGALHLTGSAVIRPRSNGPAGHAVVVFECWKPGSSPDYPTRTTREAAPGRVFPV